MLLSLRRHYLGGLAQREAAGFRAHFEVALMESDHCRTMADRHDRRPRQPARQDGVELRLELLVDSGRRFVEEQPVWPHQARAIRTSAFRRNRR